MNKITISFIKNIITFNIALAIIIIATNIFNANAQIIDDNLQLDAMSRYAFISDSHSPKIVAFDAYQHKIAATLTLETQPKNIAISRYGKYIIYASDGAQTIHKLNLTTQQHETPYEMQDAVRDNLVAHVDGRWFAYRSAQHVVSYDTQTQQATRIAVNGKTELFYSAANIENALFIAELESGKLTKLDLQTAETQILLQLNTAISPISAMPNNMALFFSANHQLQSFSLLDNKLMKINELPADFRPYITSEGRTILALSKNADATAQLLAINAYTTKTKNSYQLPTLATTADLIVTGWLEQIAIIATQHGLQTIDLSNDNQKSIALLQQISAMIVHPNSKLMLAILQNDPHLLLFNTRNQEVISYIELGLQQPQRIIMGQTATICH